MKDLAFELHERKQNDELWIDVTVSNQGEVSILIEKSDRTIPLLSEEAFEVRKARDDAPVSYIGPMAKRKVQTVADFEPLKPGGAVRKSIRLDNTYAFDDGSSTYRIRWYLLVWDHEENGAGTVASQWLTLALTSGASGPPTKKFGQDPALREATMVHDGQLGLETALILTAADNAIAQEDRPTANALLKRGLDALGDRYLSPDTIDDTGTKLVLADAEERRGALSGAVRLRRAVLASRLHQLQQHLSR